MRLTCPNCEAQYEVPDEVIPSEGRDVQCSNCGDTWYQAGSNTTTAEVPNEAPIKSSEPAPAPAEAEAEAEAEPPVTEDNAVAGEQDALSDDSTGPEHSPEPEPEPDHISEPEAEDPIEEAPQHTLGLARGMDPSVTGILREEAEREAQLRAAESAELENQPDIALETDSDDETSRRANQARDRMARMKGENPALRAAAESGSRRGLLPDIEEINSTLRAGSNPTVAASDTTDHPLPAQRKSGFSRGFAVVLILVLALVMIYANARQIAETLPQADPYLSSYVAMVDQARLWLDAKVSNTQ
ncbi:zinc-ribbon domain-containing protein [Parasedimentitalea huanghaiensis]|uniref:Thioredoxin n=1 Tax=Parasedimentitalea huanghaiensis TaxID=2682100 RepID=A0A6L6WBN0_9RHOB|nr:zinc-ribbon domain-containing protein [Zongyanglinia huanghaiensis]MVO15094.1 thioredoxin [Zongyanglinia huanghaiensis]